VLVVPYTVFTLDRANHLIDLVELMEERFPNVLDPNSNTSKFFYILITKSINQLQRDSFGDRLKEHILEETKNKEKSNKAHNN
jgi:hypothetical protein